MFAEIAHTKSMKLMRKQVGGCRSTYLCCRPWRHFWLPPSTRTYDVSFLHQDPTGTGSARDLLLLRARILLYEQIGRLLFVCEGGRERDRGTKPYATA